MDWYLRIAKPTCFVRLSDPFWLLLIMLDDGWLFLITFDYWVRKNCKLTEGPRNPSPSRKAFGRHNSIIIIIISGSSSSSSSSSSNHNSNSNNNTTNSSNNTKCRQVSFIEFLLGLSRLAAGTSEAPVWAQDHGLAIFVRLRVVSHAWHDFCVVQLDQALHVEAHKIGLDFLSCGISLYVEFSFAYLFGTRERLPEGGEAAVRVLHLRRQQGRSFLILLLWSKHINIFTKLLDIRRLPDTWNMGNAGLCVCLLHLLTIVILLLILLLLLRLLSHRPKLGIVMRPLRR